MKPLLSPVVGGYPSAGALAFSPVDVAGLQLWLDASDESTITESGGSVSQWDDKSGNGNHVSQGTAVKQPFTGTRNVNSLNVLDFNGKRLSTSFSTALTTPFTVLGVAGTDDTASPRYWFLDDGTNDDFNRIGINATNYRIFDGSFVSSSGGVNTDPHLWNMVFDGANSSLRIDASEVLSGNPGSTNLDGVIIGELPNGANFWDGFVAEVVVYEGVLSTADREAVEQYLADRWAVTLS